MKNKGFTLIELLVVIAIIGILSAIVLASLDTARNKGADAAAKADLDNARSQAENYYDSNGQSYLNACTTPANGAKPGIQDMMQGAASAEGGVYTTGSTGVSGTPSGNVVCHDSAGAWAAATALKAGGYWCIDNTGTSTATSVGLITSVYACP